MKRWHFYLLLLAILLIGSMVIALISEIWAGIAIFSAVLLLFALVEFMLYWMSEN